MRLGIATTVQLTAPHVTATATGTISHQANVAAVFQPTPLLTTNYSCTTLPVVMGGIGTRSAPATTILPI